MTLGAPSRATPVDFSTLKVAENVWPKVAMRRKASSAVSATSNDTTPRGVGRDITCVIPTDLGTADTARQQQTATSMRATHGRPAPNHLPGDHAHNALPARLEARVITDEEGDDAAQNIRGGDNFMSGAQKLVSRVWCSGEFEQILTVYRFQRHGIML
ncbi:hypothetical protein BC832DRAFT_71171 [Gaertneriomyces semiglobifer]|nr:hypothetical protein BC832DRAFT_71171 [Gaertneriomyces semiglobifer]